MQQNKFSQLLPIAGVGITSNGKKGRETMNRGGCRGGGGGGGGGIAARRSLIALFVFAFFRKAVMRGVG